MPDLLTNSVTFKIDDEEFVFRAPSPLDMARVGVIAGSIRRELDPAGLGNEVCIDWQTSTLIESMAIMEVLLERGPKWAYSEKEDRSGKKHVVVDRVAFPPNKTNVLRQIPSKFSEEVSRFLAGGDTGGQSTSEENI